MVRKVVKLGGALLNNLIADDLKNNEYIKPIKDKLKLLIEPNGLYANDNTGIKEIIIKFTNDNGTLEEFVKDLDDNEEAMQELRKTLLKAVAKTDFKNHFDIMFSTLTSTESKLIDGNKPGISLNELRNFIKNPNTVDKAVETTASDIVKNAIKAAEESKGGKGKRGGKRSQKGGWADISLANDMAFIANTGDLGITPTPESQAGASMQNSLAATAAPFSAGANMNSALRDLPPVLSGTLDLPLTLGGGKKKGKGKKAAPKAPKPTKPKKAPKKK